MASVPRALPETGNPSGTGNGVKHVASGERGATGAAAGAGRTGAAVAGSAGRTGQSVPLTASGRHSAAASHRAVASLGGSSQRSNGAAASLGRGLEGLNDRLNASLPTGQVAYSSRAYTNDLSEAIEAAREGYYRAAAPPADVLAKALYVVQQRAGIVAGSRTSVLYVLHKRNILGFEICTGWKVENDGSGAIGGYTFGPCGGEQFTPTGGLPTLAPKPAAT